MKEYNRNTKRKKYDIILWDVDGTLLDFLASERYAILETFRRYGIEIDEEIIQTYSKINEGYWKRLEKKEVTKIEVLRGRFVTLLDAFYPGGLLAHKQIDLEQIKKLDIEEIRLVYQEKLGSVFAYQDNSLEVCKRLRKEGFHQFIITNGVTSTQQSRLQMAGFYDVMDDVFISEEIGFDKPDIRFFEGCFQRMRENGFDIDFDRLIIIGDSQTSDMQGARNMNIDSCLYIGGKDLEHVNTEQVDYILSDLRKVDDIVWQEVQTKS